MGVGESFHVTVTSPPSTDVVGSADGGAGASSVRLNVLTPPGVYVPATSSSGDGAASNAANVDGCGAPRGDPGDDIVAAAMRAAAPDGGAMLIGVGDAALDIPGPKVSSGSCDPMRPGDVFVVEGAVSEEAMQDADYDDLVGKLIVWGRDREEARKRMLRALAEFEVDGIATTIPAHVAILSHPDFAAAEHSTKWVEERLDLSGIAAAPPPAVMDDDQPEKVRRDVDVEVNGKRFSVSVWAPDVAPVFAAEAGGATAVRPRPRPAAAAGGGSGSVAVPMQGTIVKVLVAVGDQVEAGQAVCVLEATKMENQITAETSGEVKEVKVEAGQAVGGGDVVVVIG